MQLTQAEKDWNMMKHDKHHAGGRGGSFEDYSDLVIEFGFITLFISALPIAPLIAFINNVLELRRDAHLLCYGFRREPHRTARDVGSWFSVLQFTALLSGITNVALVVFVSDTLSHVNMDRRLLIFFVAEHAIFATKVWIAKHVPSEPESIAQTVKRQDFLISQLNKSLVNLDGFGSIDGASSDVQS